MQPLVKMPFIPQRILSIRGQHVMLDRDLAELYGVETRVLNQAVQRHMNRFPPDFMFQLNPQEFILLKSQFVTSSSQVIKNSDNFENWKSQSVTSNWGGVRKRPYAFTEQGVAMLSSVLRSARAVEVNIAIMRSFVEMRAMILSHKDLEARLNEMEAEYDECFREVFRAIRELTEAPKAAQGKTQTGFIPREEKLASKARRA